MTIIVRNGWCLVLVVLIPRQGFAMPDDIFSPAALQRSVTHLPPALTSPPPVPRTHLPWWAWAALLGSQGFEAGTTIDGMRRGYREVNPILRPIAGNPYALMAAKLGTGAGMGYGLDHLYRTRPTLTLVMVGFASAVPMAVGVMNWRTIRSRAEMRRL